MIIITGDSWACGEWDIKGIQHQGIAQLLREQGHSVVNLGIPSANNSDVIRHLKWFLENNPSADISQIIFFKTDIARLVNPPDFTRGFAEFIAATNFGVYFKLSAVVCEYHIPCIIIGGSADTVSQTEIEQNNCQGITIAVESFVNLLIHGNPQTSCPVHSIWREHDSSHVIECVKAASNVNDVTILLEHLNKAESRIKLCESRRDLFPDGSHPGQGAHKLLLEFLQQKNMLI